MSKILATFIDKGTKQPVNVSQEVNPRKTQEAHIPLLQVEAARKLKCKPNELRYCGFKIIDGPTVLGMLPKDIKRGRR